MFDERIVAGAWLAASLALVSLAGPAAEVMQVQGTSRVLIHVGKAGAFGFAGHAHEVQAPVSGRVSLDRSDPTRSEVVLEFDAASLRVSGKGEPAQDVPEVQRVMLSERVLDAAHYPKIVFRSNRITGSGSAGASFTVTVAGELSLHGVSKAVVVPVRVRLGDGSLTAQGTATLKQTDFGIQPVTAGGGTVRVKNEVEINFTVEAGRSREHRPAVSVGSSGKRLYTPTFFLPLTSSLIR